ncbi:hypothetical protein EOD41_16750 [Mucilaginibacter limnophilus]|uniref:Molybdenum ABC transporter permease n=1 Tax=Mucilaginibacter limnophilus TaxID=1932778 RepID=A0A437MLC9_9SPHI|nr:hypothetical protein [Mucilaginibacter limnophilus]RVT98439.1 hypothetical protein EOD41_16750 [Mucilaginibacter limnophilus]
MKAHHSYIIPCGLFLFAICLFIRYHIGRRRFNRRGIGGLQQFSSYGKAVIITFLERLVLFIGNCCGLAGLGLLAVAGFDCIKF